MINRQTSILCVKLDYINFRRNQFVLVEVVSSSIIIKWPGPSVVEKLQWILIMLGTEPAPPPQLCSQQKIAKGKWALPCTTSGDSIHIGLAALLCPSR